MKLQATDRRRGIMQVLMGGPAVWWLWLRDPGMHAWAYRRRRLLNWFPIGLAYALMYMGRYNLTTAQKSLSEQLTLADFGDISTAGAWVYGISFLISGPLADRLGGRRSMLIGTAGAIAANAAMGLVLYGITMWQWDVSVYWSFMVLFAVNMHFQSYGAVSIVTVKAPWFHVNERGQFGTIFGWMIALGVYFAFDWGASLVGASRGTLGAKDPGWFGNAMATLFGFGGNGVDANWWLFYVPAILLGVMWLVMFVTLRDTPSQAGFSDFETGQTNISEETRTPLLTLIKKVFTHPVMLVVIAIEFCSGILRNGTTQWYYLIAGETGIKSTVWVTANWGLSLLIAGVIGSTLAGWASDHFFQARRGPVVALLYGAATIAAGVLYVTLPSNPTIASFAALFMVMTVFGVHGALSGTATADFGGRNTGLVVGIVDGMVYLATGLQFLVVGRLIAPAGELAKDAANWSAWPVFEGCFALIGTLLAIRIWHAKPKPKITLISS